MRTPDDARREDIACPFCGETGYDKPGLTSHFEYCEEFEKAAEEMVAHRRKIHETLLCGAQKEGGPHAD